MVPFSPAAFFSFLQHYNLSIWPLQIIAFVLGATVIFLALKALPHAGRIAATVLAAGWINTGTAYHFGYFSSLNFWDYLIGVLFLVQGAMIFWSGVIRDHFAARTQARLSKRAAVVIMIYALLGHPALALLIGRPWDGVTIFATTPTPTLLFTLGALLLLPVQGFRRLWIIPVLLCLAGAALAIALPIPEDLGLLPVALIAFYLLLSGK